MGPVSCTPRAASPWGGTDACHDDQEDTRNPADALEQEEREQGGHADGDAGWVPCADAFEDLEQQGQEIAAARVHAGDVRPLLHGDNQGEPEREAAQHGPCYEIGHRAETCAAGEQKCDAGAEHQERCERDALLESAAAQGHRGRCEDGRG
jgi:hypothetical protein